MLDAIKVVQIFRILLYSLALLVIVKPSSIALGNELGRRLSSPGAIQEAAETEEEEMSETERKGAVTFKGNPITLIGAEVKKGDKAPDFKVLANDLSEVSLANSKGTTRIISVVPSLDTPVCDLQTKRFNEEAGKLPGNVKVLTVSMDLPFAQKRWCGAAGATHVQTLSDHRDASFGKAYGVLIKELRLLTRAIFVVGPDDKVQYAEYVKEVTQHPDYDKALASIQASSRA